MPIYTLNVEYYIERLTKKQTVVGTDRQLTVAMGEYKVNAEAHEFGIKCIYYKIEIQHQRVHAETFPLDLVFSMMIMLQLVRQAHKDYQIKQKCRLI